MTERASSRRRPLRIALLVLSAVVVLGLAGIAVFVATFNPNRYKPEIEAAVKRATGRELVLKGPIRLAVALQPTIEVKDAALANPPGFSRPEMATIRAIDLRLALLPLLQGRVEISRLVLLQPDILLERSKTGAVNWRFAPPAAPTPTAPTAPTPPGAPKTAAARTQVFLANLRIDNGRIAYRDDRTGKTTRVDVGRLTVTAASATAPLHVAMSARADGVPFSLNADAGSLARLQDTAARTPWPVRLSLSAAGATLKADGTITEPMSGRGYALTLDATLPDLAVLRSLLPGMTLPSLQDVALTARVADSGGPIPAVSALRLRAGASDLGALVPGLKLAKLDVAAPASDRPMDLTAAGSLSGTPLALTAHLGAPAALLAVRPGGPFPVDVVAHAGGANLTAKGAIADPRRMSGVDLAVNAAIPDLAALSALARQSLPPLKNVAFQGHVISQGDMARGVTLRDARLTSPQGDLAGTLSLRPGSPPAIDGAVTSKRLDADALLAAFRPATPALAPGKAPAPAPAPAKPAPEKRMFPDTPLPFAALRSVNADLRFSVGALRTRGETWRDVAGHLVLAGGKLRLAPFTAIPPAGKLTMTLSADATKPAPPVALSLHAPGLALASVLAALGQPGYAKGDVAVAADVSGAGMSPHAIAASLDGTVTLSMNGGQIETRVLQNAFGGVIAAINPVSTFGGAATSDIRCFALRLTARHGVGEVYPFLLSSSLITMDGTGRVNLGPETLDMTLHPQGRVAGTGFSVPVAVTGALAHPKVTLSSAGAAQTGIGVALDLLSGHGKLPPGAAGPAPMSCETAMSILHGGKPPPKTQPTTRVPPPAPAPAVPAAKPPNPADLLRQLFR